MALEYWVTYNVVTFKKQQQKPFTENKQVNWSNPMVLYQLEHIKCAVINSLLWMSVVGNDVWSFICDVAHGALCVLLL